MTNEIYFSVTGRNEDGKLIPFFGEVRVGHESVTVFGEAEGLGDKLRAVLAAMHLANAMGIAEFNIKSIIEECDDDRVSAEAMLRPFEDYRPADREKIKTAHASFYKPTPEENSEMQDDLRRFAAKVDRLYGLAEDHRQAGRYGVCEVDR